LKLRREHSWKLRELTSILNVAPRGEGRERESRDGRDGGRKRGENREKKRERERVVAIKKMACVRFTPFFQYMYIYIYVHVYIHMYLYIYIYIYAYVRFVKAL